MSISIRFIDFPSNFSSEENIFINLLTSSLGLKVKVEQRKKPKVDLEICSNFIQENRGRRLISRLLAESSTDAMSEYEQKWVWGFRSEYRTTAKKRIWYTGENLRPPIGFFDGTMSFNPSDKDSGNVFFPFWMQKINWFSNQDKNPQFPRPAELTASRVPQKRDIDICTFSSKFEPGRERIVRALPKNIRFVGFGRQYSNLVDSKHDTSTKFGLQLCSENDLYPNYVTEKLIESWQARSVPIWAGIDQMNLFNKKAFIDVTYLNSQQITQRLANLNKEELIYIQSQPILNEVPKIDDVIDFLKNVLG